MKTKTTEVFFIFTQYNQCVERNFECKIKYLQSDFRGNYRKFQYVLTNLGI